MNGTVFDTASKYAQAGYSVIPLKLDGTKQPDIDSWGGYQQRQPTDAELSQWFDNPRPAGIGLITGFANLYAFDIDDSDLIDRFLNAARAAWPEVEQYAALVRTPRPGLQIICRLDRQPPGNRRYAFRASENGNGDLKAFIESRGTGGYVVGLGSPIEVHRNRVPYQQLAGPGLCQLPVIDQARFERLEQVCRSFNEAGFQQAEYVRPNKYQGEPRPGDIFNVHADWTQLLKDKGWSLHHQTDSVAYLVRPGKQSEEGYSATLGYVRDDDGQPLLCVFSTADPLGPKDDQDCATYSKFDFFVHAYHQGDVSAAAAQARLLFESTLNAAQVEYHSQQPDTEAIEYQRPLPMQPFPVEVLPPVMRNLVEYVAATTNCDPAAAFTHFIALLASLIGNSHRIKLRQEFVEPCVLWTSTIGESGRGKTPPFKAVMRLLDPLSADLRRRNQRASDRYRVEKAQYNLAFKSWQRTAAGSPPLEPEKPQILTAVTTDATIEAIGWLHQQNLRGFIYASNELTGWYESFGSYTGARGRDLSQWLMLHDGVALKVDRKGIDPDTGSRTIYVPQSSVSVTGTIQPAVMRHVFDSRAHDAGLVARILLAWPEWSFSSWSAKKSANDQHFADAVRLVGALHDLEMRENDFGDPEPNIVTISPQAERHWADFYDDTRRASFGFCSEHGGFLANAYPKLIGAAARIALIVHCVRKVSGENLSEQIDAESMQAGIAVADWYKGETYRIFDLNTRTPAERELDDLHVLIEEHGGTMTTRQLMRRRPKAHKSTALAEAALNRLVQAGLAVWETRPTGPSGGRPTTAIRLL